MVRLHSVYAATQLPHSPSPAQSFLFLHRECHHSMRRGPRGGHVYLHPPSPPLARQRSRSPAYDQGESYQVDFGLRTSSEEGGLQATTGDGEDGRLHRAVYTCIHPVRTIHATRGRVPCTRRARPRTLRATVRLGASAHRWNVHVIVRRGFGRMVTLLERRRRMPWSLSCSADP